MSTLDGVVVEALVIILVVAACRWFNRRRGAGAPGDLLPGPPDPYVIAWLRGGSMAVLQLAAYDLVRGSQLALVAAGPAGQALDARPASPLLAPHTTRVDQDALAEPARRLREAVTAPCDLPRLAGFAPLLAPCFASTDRTLRDHGLLLTPAQRSAGWAVTLLGMGVVLGVVFWQLPGGAPAGDGSVVALASLAAIGLCALHLLAAPEPRLSPSGRAYLVRLSGELARASASRRAAARWVKAVADRQDQEGSPAPAPASLEVALSGMAVLNGTAYAGLVALLEPTSVAPGAARFQEPSS